MYVFTVVSTCVAAAILAAVEGGIVPPEMASLSEELTAKPTRISAGQDARLYGRQDACRYGKHVTVPLPSAITEAFKQDSSENHRAGDHRIEIGIGVLHYEAVLDG